MEFLHAFEVEALTLEAGLVLFCLALATVIIGAVAEQPRVRRVARWVGHEEALTGLTQAA